MDILHLSLLGKTKYKSLNGNWMHLAHVATSNYHLMAFIDGYGKGFIRNGDEMRQAKCGRRIPSQKTSRTSPHPTSHPKRTCCAAWQRTASAQAR